MALPAKSSPPPARNTAAPALGIPGLCTAASELAALLYHETALIRAMKLTEIEPLQADKARLTKLCGTALKEIDPKAPISTALRDRWRAVSKKLGDAAIANEMALRVGHAATDRLVSAIVGHIENRHNAAKGYARPNPVANGASRRPALAGVTIDRHL
jgi:hypothetical protein